MVRYFYYSVTNHIVSVESDKLIKHPKNYVWEHEISEMVANVLVQSGTLIKYL